MLSTKASYFACSMTKRNPLYISYLSLELRLVCRNLSRTRNPKKNKKISLLKNLDMIIRVQLLEVHIEISD